VTHNPLAKFLSFITLLAGLAATGGAGGQPAGEFNIRTIPAELAAQVQAAPAVVDAIGKAMWDLLRRVSNQVRDGGLTGIAEAAYMPLEAQRRLFRAVADSPAVPDDVRLVLEDLIVQYYFFTYYYDGGDPRRKEFRDESRRFLQGLGVEYAWVELAAQNYYRHTFLRTLVRTLPESRWGAFYRRIFVRTGFRELPREAEGEGGEGETGADLSRSTARFAGEVMEGHAFEQYFGPGFRLRLEPRPLGWEITVRYLDGDENIARLTPPFHFLPNPREIEGWHFRNSDNSGANEPGEKNVNAPGEEREFIFSPEVGRAIQGPGSRSAPDEKDVEKVRAFGRGTLRILQYRLGNLKAGEQAKFEWMRFEVELAWPSEYGPAPG
jgi:hypothetical protein